MIATDNAEMKNDKVSIGDIPAQNKTFTVDEAIEKMGFGKFQIKLSLVTGLAWMADSMEMMLLSILAPALHCEWSLKSWQKALITTVVFCGMMFGSPFWGKICDHYGRRICLFFCTLFTFIFGFLSSFSPSIIAILAFRGLVGFGIGGAPQAVTLFSEFLPIKQRAKCVVFSNIFWSIGACLEVSLAILIMPKIGWRWLLGISALPLVIFILLCLWLPESARFYMITNKHELALKTLQRVAKDNKSSLPEGSLKIIESDLKRGQFKDLLSKDHRKTSIMLWIIWFANAFSYYGIVLVTTELFQINGTCGVQISHFHYSTFNESNGTSIEIPCNLQLKDYTDLLLTTVAEFPGLIITIIIIDLLGRKKTLSLEFIVFSLFMFLVNICVSRPVLVFFLFVARCFISGAFQASYVYTPEYYPTTMRAIGLGTCSGFARIGAIITPFIAQVLMKASPYAAISLYGCVALIAAILTFFLPVETKGRDMKETSAVSPKV